MRDGALWEAITKYYISIVRKISAPSRRFYTGDGDGKPRAAFDREWVEAYSDAHEKLERSLTTALAQRAARDAHHGSKRQLHDKDPDSLRAKKQQRKAEAAAAKKAAADAAAAAGTTKGTRHRAKGVTAGDTVKMPAAKDLKEWAKGLSITDPSNKPPCWHFHHPQGCQFTAETCKFSHVEA